ncbi:MAG: hypothetical protein KIT83_18550, partial [Bryobacterales bacterium]|nr:hypothetical protein [Bryobacterales bacterium]
MLPRPIDPMDGQAYALLRLRPARLRRLCASAAVAIPMLLSAFFLTIAWLPPVHGRLPDKAISEIAALEFRKLPFWLKLRDPAQRVREAGDCMVVATTTAECVPLLELALAANSRNTQAALWLALIAAHEEDIERAQHWLRFARQRDHSFAVLWSNWQMAPAASGFLLPSKSDEELILMAPAGFRGHFPLLLERGWDADALFTL